MQFNTNNKEPGELVLYSPPECSEGIFCYYKDKACIYKHDGQNLFIVNTICTKNTRCNYINKLCKLKHSVNKKIRGYINPDLVCDRRICKGFEINTCKKLHPCDYDECMRYASTFRYVEEGVSNFMKNILPKINADRIMKKMGLPIINQLAPPPHRDRSRSRERHRSHRDRSRSREKDRSHRDRSRSRERNRSRSRERDRSRSRERNRSRSREKHRYNKDRPRSRERHRSRSRDNKKQPQQFQVHPQHFQAPPQQFQASPQQFQASPQQFQAPPQQFRGPPQQYQGPPQYYQDYPLRVAVTSNPYNRMISIQPKQTQVSTLISSAINEGKNKIITNVNDFETKCRNFPSCHLHNFQACKFMHKEQIEECLSLYEKTRDIKSAQDLAHKMMAAASSRFKSTSTKKNTNNRYFDTCPDYIPL